METGLYLFKECPWARAVWLSSALAIKADGFPQTSLFSWLTYMFNQLDKNDEIVVGLNFIAYVVFSK